VTAAAAVAAAMAVVASSHLHHRLGRIQQCSQPFSDYCKVRRQLGRLQHENDRHRGRLLCIGTSILL
jgi:hypothetical protein